MLRPGCADIAFATIIFDFWIELGENQWNSKSFREGGELEGYDGERCGGGGVQENECVCILKAVFLLQEKK